MELSQFINVADLHSKTEIEKVKIIAFYNNFLSHESDFDLDEVFDLLYEGANNYINEIYGKDWKEKYPEPKSE